MHVDRLAAAIQAQKQALEVLQACLAVAQPPGVLGEPRPDRRPLDFLLKQIHLVQKQNKGRVGKPARVEQRVEEHDGLVHAVDALVLKQHLVVLAHREHEQHCCDALEAVDPLAPLAALPTGVVYLEGVRPDLEPVFRDPRSLDAALEDVCVVAHVVHACELFDIVEVVSRRALQLELAGAVETLADALVLRPQCLDGPGDLLVCQLGASASPASFGPGADAPLGAGTGASRELLDVVVAPVKGLHLARGLYLALGLAPRAVLQHILVEKLGAARGSRVDLVQRVGVLQDLLAAHKLGASAELVAGQLDPQPAGLVDQRSHRLDGVCPDHLPVLHAFLMREATLV